MGDNLMDEICFRCGWGSVSDDGQDQPSPEWWLCDCCYTITAMVWNLKDWHQTRKWTRLERHNWIYQQRLQRGGWTFDDWLSSLYETWRPWALRMVRRRAQRERKRIERMVSHG